jgi:hypothetical protein
MRLPAQRTLAVVCLAFSVACTAAAQHADDRPSTAEDIRDHLAFLAADVLEGRGVGTAGLDSSAAYIAGQFARIGLEPAGTEGFFQSFVVDETATAAAHAGVGNLPVQNVVGVLPGRGRLAGQAVVVGAHYDHLGYGGFGSLDPDSTGVVHNGADDNASGTVALIETARLLAQRTATDVRTVVFVAFTAEELGLIGSSHYVKHPVVPGDSTLAMINFDMVGRLRDGKVLAMGTGSALEFPALLEDVNGLHGLTVNLVGDPWGRSDHISFYGDSIPVVHLFTDNHEDYHRTTDDWPKINVEGIGRIVDFAADLAWTLALREAPLTYVDVGPPPRVAGGGYGAYLGTIPDMSESPGGVRLTGVRTGSPAEAAGLRKGDILIQLGDHAVGNLYDMTNALRAHKPGDGVAIVVLRDGERFETFATLGRRGG